MLKVAEDSTIKVTIYADGDYSIITPEDQFLSNNTQSTMENIPAQW